MSVRSIRILCAAFGISTLLVCAYSFGQLRTASTFSEQPALPTLIIDAGHGGEDGGCVGVNGTNESAINLSISLRLRDLAVFCGIPVKMIRTTDTAVYQSGCKTISEKKVSDIRERTRMVNETPHSVLVSIHQNYFPQQKYHGAQVFFSKSSGSKAFAEGMQLALRNGIDPQNHRLAKPSQSVYLLDHVTCPAILIECGFLSNAEEAELLLTPSYQIRLSAVICAQSLNYLSQEEYKSEI